VAVEIVADLEVVHVDEGEDERLTGPVRPGDLVFERQEPGVTAVGPRQPVDGRLDPLVGGHNPVQAGGGTVGLGMEAVAGGGGAVPSGQHLVSDQLRIDPAGGGGTRPLLPLAFGGPGVSFGGPGVSFSGPGVAGVRPAVPCRGGRVAPLGEVVVLGGWRSELERGIVPLFVVLARGLDGPRRDRRHGNTGGQQVLLPDGRPPVERQRSEGLTLAGQRHGATTDDSVR
jgi:hypothetical protein